MSKKNIGTSFVIGAICAVGGYFSKDILSMYKERKEKKSKEDFLESIEKMSKFRDAVNAAIESNAIIEFGLDSYRSNLESLGRRMTEIKEIIFNEENECLNESLKEMFISLSVEFSEVNEVIDSMESCATIICISSRNQKITDYAASEFEVFVNVIPYKGIVNRKNCVEVFEKLNTYLNASMSEMYDKYYAINNEIMENDVNEDLKDELDNQSKVTSEETTEEPFSDDISSKEETDVKESVDPKEDEEPEESVKKQKEPGKKRTTKEKGASEKNTDAGEENDTERVFEKDTEKKSDD